MGTPESNDPHDLTHLEVAYTPRTPWAADRLTKLYPPCVRKDDMGYLLRKQKSPPGWRVVHRLDHGKGRVEERTVKPGTAEYQTIGLNPTLTFPDAEVVITRVREHQKSLDQVKRLAKIDERIKEQGALTAAWLPEWVVAEFETTVVPAQNIRADRWGIAKKIISRLSVPPEDWRWSPHVIFNAFSSRGDSLNYARRLLRIMNEYGAFYCRKTGKAFLPVEKPVRDNRIRIVRAHESMKPRRDTLTVTPDEVGGKRNGLSPEEYNGVQIALWFGLRREEAKKIASTPQNTDPDGKGWYIERDDRGFDVLLVYQDKEERMGVAFRHRWKAIPAVEPEQVSLLPLLHSQRHKLPGTKKLRSVFGKAVTNRSWRKSFVREMQRRGYRDTVVRKWLGHVGDGTMERNYDDKTQAYWEPPVKRRVG